MGLNYRHLYHAGSFTDVVKHIVLTVLLTSLLRKEKAFCYLDTHAGAGYYDLFSDTAKKTNEYKNGIEKIITAKNPPALVQEYLQRIQRINNQWANMDTTTLRYYPGSPLIVHSLMRL